MRGTWTEEEQWRAAKQALASSRSKAARPPQPLGPSPFALPTGATIRRGGHSERPSGGVIEPLRNSMRVD